MSRPSSITLEDCQSLFYLPVAQAAVVLGVSRPTISKVLRAHGIKRWPYRKLRAEGKIEDLRQRREGPSTSVLPILPPLPPPPPLPPFAINPNHHNHPTTSDTTPRNDHSATSVPLFPQPEPQQCTPDDETYILHLLDQPISPRQIEDHTHPLLSLDPEPVWTCNEQLSPQYPEPHHYPPMPQSPSSPPPPSSQQQEHYYHQKQEDDLFHPDTRSHTISTVRPAARATMGAGNWSRGVFKQNGDRISFAFLPPAPMGSSLSDEDPLHANAGIQLES